MPIVLSNPLLILDAIINLILGGLLIWYPPALVEAMGLPLSPSRIFPDVLGGVLIGIGVALILEDRRTGIRPVGLGLGGAIAINLCGAVALASSLLSARPALTHFGQVFLWGLVFLLVLVSGFEWLNLRRTSTK